MTKSILITGAAKGIGKALALEMATRGYNLALTDILFDELEQNRQTINQLHPSVRVETRKLDISDYDRVYDVINELDDAMGGLDTVYANAGIFFDGWIGQGNFHKYKKTVEINLLGGMATIDAAVSLFKKRNRGHIAAPASIAAVRSLRGSGAYCATKMGITMFLETVRTELVKTDIKVSVLFPGYIDTDLNKNIKSRPFLIPVEKGAKIIANLLEKQVKSSTVPVFPWNIIKHVLKILPVRIMARM
ncbi:MAG TPA: SDR family NAD(P)-dependent oxidoreductase [Spirochaetota bacterium]|nr:SDR family NAD(P)-dependent oxidoreductase [Spirochaetota bacterium]HPI89723.1 SDR family NAD(P)-dependent oxidoreductase [Spirochaetota bacterium]HPR46644.1 SDR family NAD(P)-dependent oxidoreductase [Spirochaetota bacterium]